MKPEILNAIMLLEDLIEGTLYDKYDIDYDTCKKIREAIEKLEEL